MPAQRFWSVAIDKLLKGSPSLLISTPLWKSPREFLRESPICPLGWPCHFLLIRRTKIGIEGGHPCAVYFHCNRALQQAHGYNDSLSPFYVLQDPFKSTKRAAFDTYPLTNSDVRPRLVRKSGTYQSTNSR